MPTVLIVGAYRFFFWSYDCSEPAHIHVQRERMVCKIWLETLQVASNNGFRARELRGIQRIVEDNIDLIRRAWDEHCNPA